MLNDSDYEVKIPDSKHGITRKTIRGITYIYYAYDRKYSSEKHYTVPKNTTIGKCLDASAETMYPNINFLKYFPEAELPETRGIADRSACLRIGAFTVIRKVIAEYHLDEIHEYSMDYAVTATQKSILKAFDLAETNVRKQAAGINEDLKSCNTKKA